MNRHPFVRSLHLHGFVNPVWFRSHACGSWQAIVSPDRLIDLDGQPLSFTDDPPPAGETVTIWLAGGSFVCASSAELGRHEEEERLLVERQKAQGAALLDARREKALAFNARIGLPVAWDVAYKEVLSGLSATSCGDGRRRDTVCHVLLLAPLVTSTLQRPSHVLLCTSRSGNDGDCWSDDRLARGLDGSGLVHPLQVTCKACLRLATRWLRPITQENQT